MKVTLLAGGTGGAKLAHGFQATLQATLHATLQATPPAAPPAAQPRGELTVIVNVADDTERFGLLVCPDIDTILYTLSGLADREQGWGVRGDTYT
ncbi:MAG: 2-phospho-L-lactate transferase CofD family protein, partial [Candidatus Limnocylindria bacterium]